MHNASVSIQFIDTYGEPIDELTFDQMVAPKHAADAFQRKYQQGPELLCHGILARWRYGSWDEFETLFWLQKHDLVRFGDLPKDQTEWEDWLRSYANEIDSAGAHPEHEGQKVL